MIPERPAARRLEYLPPLTQIFHSNVSGNGRPSPSPIKEPLPWNHFSLLASRRPLWQFTRLCLCRYVNITRAQAPSFRSIKALQSPFRNPITLPFSGIVNHFAHRFAREQQCSANEKWQSNSISGQFFQKHITLHIYIL